MDKLTVNDFVIMQCDYYFASLDCQYRVRYQISSAASYVVYIYKGTFEDVYSLRGCIGGPLNAYTHSSISAINLILYTLDNINN